MKSIQQETGDGNREWRSVNGFDGHYEVSSDGHVRRVSPGWQHKPGTELRASPHRCGYPRVKLQVGRTISYRYVHCLVSEAFLGPVPAGCQVNHIDGNKANCDIRNLEYVTPKDNMHHARETGLFVVDYKCEKNPMAKLTPEQVKDIRNSYIPYVNGYKRLGKKYGVHHMTISLIINGKNWASM